ncbi:hypothetical protein [Schlesneria sp.]|uniref:hypothetical protein n=1 Tax=Schlesneria sp. TaxID=2762018 RepID=UPI002F0001A2
MLWWKGEGNAFGETFATCLFLLIGLATFLSFWWVANNIELRFRSDTQAKTEPVGALQELKGCLLGGISLPIVFLMMALAGWGPRHPSPWGNQNARVDGKYDHVKMVPYTKNSVLPAVAKRSATLTYWQAAVANLHLVRFQFPSGQEPAEKFYERLFQQLQQQAEAAKRASTANVDVDLVQMVARHLVIENELLQLKDQLDEYMKKEKLAQPADTIDQRMALTELLFGSVHADPDVLEKMDSGPIREWIKKGLRAQEQRQQQFREIELMQAVLQERYSGTTFALPTITP